MISESNPPRDTDGAPPSALDLTRRIVAERMPQFLKSEKMRAIHKQRRTLELARQMHSLGQATLPLPNFAAFTEMQRVEYDEENPFPYVAECIFILTNQCDEEKLFLSGSERRKAIIKACKGIHAHNAVDYLLCIREMLDEIKKKQISSAKKMTEQAEILIQQISSSLLRKPSGSPLTTS